MRALLALGVACLVWTAGAAASVPLLPPPSRAVVQVDHGKAKSAQMSCSAHARARIAGARRKLVPVACEQPPRSHVRDVGVALLLGP